MTCILVESHPAQNPLRRKSLLSSQPVLLYADDIVILASTIYDLHKQLKVL